MLIKRLKDALALLMTITALLCFKASLTTSRGYAAVWSMVLPGQFDVLDQTIRRIQQQHGKHSLSRPASFARG